jgi:hypothetical protein
MHTLLWLGAMLLMLLQQHTVVTVVTGMACLHVWKHCSLPTALGYMQPHICLSCITRLECLG